MTGGQGAAGVAEAPASRLDVCHETVYDYGSPVEHAHHVVHLAPRETATQRVEGWRLAVEPEPDGAPVRPFVEVVDVWGNRRHGFSHTQVHDRLRIVSRFRAAITRSDPPPLACGPPWETVAHRMRYRAGDLMPPAVEFALGSALAPRDPALRALAADLFPAGRPLLEAADALMRRIHERFEYLPASTHVGTSAVEALALQHGVCQDFAHVMIGALRSMGLAARYVSGYLLTQPPPGQPRLVGADASHAWVGVWCPLNGWVAFDPTNAVIPGTSHVTLAWGRDYTDVAPVHGVIRGGRGAQLAVAVTVAPAAPEPEAEGEPTDRG